MPVAGRRQFHQRKPTLLLKSNQPCGRSTITRPRPRLTTYPPRGRLIFFSNTAGVRSSAIASAFLSPNFGFPSGNDASHSAKALSAIPLPRDLRRAPSFRSCPLLRSRSLTAGMLSPHRNSFANFYQTADHATRLRSISYRTAGMERRFAATIVGNWEEPSGESRL